MRCSTRRRFWLERGVDGFRLDTINFYVHSAGLEDNPPLPESERNDTIAPSVNPYNYQDHLYDKSQPENLDFLKRFRDLLDEYPAAAAVGEVGDAQRGLQIVAAYTAGDERVQMCYAFDFLSPEKISASKVRSVLETFGKVASDGWSCWAFSNHDVVRHASRWGVGEADRTAYLKVISALLMSLRGSVCIYQGEELGLNEAEIAFETSRILMASASGRNSRAAMAAARRWSGTRRAQWRVLVRETLVAGAIGTYRDGRERAAGRKGFGPGALPALPRVPAGASALCKGEIEFLAVEGDAIAFVRREGNEQLACAFNLGSKPATIDLEVLTRRPRSPGMDFREPRPAAPFVSAPMAAGSGVWPDQQNYIGRKIMADLTLRDVRKAYGNIEILHGINLDITSGEFIVFVGPSGCGKSTLLRAIAGLEDITSGTLQIAGETMNDVPPSKRGIAMVFQSYALYPHMTVYDNMAFGMKIARENKTEIDRRVRRAAGILQLTPNFWSGCRRRSREGSASESRLAAPLCATRRCSFSTNLCPISMQRCGSQPASRSPS